MFKRSFQAMLVLLATLSAVYAITPTGIFSENQNSYVKNGFNIVSVEDSLTAAAGGGQTNAYQLAASFSRFTVVATAADSAKLMVCGPNLVGLQVIVANADASDAMNVFPAVGDFINLLTVNTAISVPAVKAMIFTCVSTGKWQSIVSN